MIFAVIIICIASIIHDVICEKRKNNKTKKPIEKLDLNNQDWRKLPASEVFGGISAMKRTSKEWHDKPLTF